VRRSRSEGRIMQ